ncbi:alkene reductase [Flavobacterium sp. FlaQc-47]|uniref:alkene reductase n=1 Tax=Flavobacterium sp. FlaQc-47 TaxID=3374180 RepID=UPI0037568C5A
MSITNNNLFEPFIIGKTKLNNKIIMAPMTRGRADHQTHLPHFDIEGTYYQQRATAGLIISEGIAVSSKAIGSVNIPGLYNQQQIAQWKKITDRVHQSGGKIFAQLWHVGRISHPDLLDGNFPEAPSAINPKHWAFTPTGIQNTVTPRALSVQEIIQIEDNFKSAALNAIEAGFDGVEIHAANSYLFHQFFADSSNEREDQYGGSTENKTRFLFETLDKIAGAIGSEKTGIRLSPLWSGAGIELDDALKHTFDVIISKLNNYDLAYLHLTGIGSLNQNNYPNPTDEIIETTGKYRKIFRGSIIINGGFDKTSAQVVLNQDVADLVSFGVPFIANPNLVERFKDDIALSSPDTDTFYQGGTKGYIDYPVR